MSDLPVKPDQAEQAEQAETAVAQHESDAEAESALLALADTDTAPVAPAAPAHPAIEVVPPRPSDSHVRCFLALNFPVHTVRRLADEMAALKAPVAAAGLTVRWVPAPNLHLTLKFLGAVKLAAVEAIAAKLAAGLSALRPFELEARGMGAFPSLEEPRVLWVGVTAQPALVALQQAIEGWMEELGLPREERPFHPHITVGRVSGGATGQPKPDHHHDHPTKDQPTDLGAILGERASRTFGTGRATEVVIYESRTLSRGAEYHALGRVPLLSLGQGLGLGQAARNDSA